MADRLVNDQEAVAALSARVANDIGRPAAHVEKDFWVTEVLRGVVFAADSIGIQVIFKGGTSLSKAFSMIDRFSEDVDVLVIWPSETTKGARDRIMKDLVQGASDATGITAENVAAATSKGSRRGARFSYQPADSRALGGLSAGVFLELGSRGGGLPASVMAISSALAIHASTELSGTAEAEPIKVRVLAPCRTLVEKLVLLHAAHGAEHPADAVRGARHYYDVHQLLADADVLRDLATYGVSILSRDVYTYSKAAEMPAADRPTGGFSESPAFKDGPHLDLARSEYEKRVVPFLLWHRESAPTFDECLESVRRYSERL